METSGAVPSWVGCYRAFDLAFTVCIIAGGDGSILFLIDKVDECLPGSLHATFALSLA